MESMVSEGKDLKAGRETGREGSGAPGASSEKLGLEDIVHLANRIGL